MGSQSTPVVLPDANSPSLVLTRPTEEERRQTWSLTHPNWGPALTLDDYLTREAYLTTVPLANNGGITHWILTDSSLPPDERPIYSSCETLRKNAVASQPAGDAGGAAVLVDGAAHGIGSVYTDSKYRGQGYASRMMQELAPRVRTWQASSKDDTPALSAGGPSTLFSVLYSDIGKTFYAKTGWAPYPSAHLSFPPPQNGYASSGGSKPTAKPIGYHELAVLCAVDEKLLRSSMAKRTEETGRTCVALLPNLDAMLWHMMREDFMTKHIFGRTPAVRGAVFGEPGKRVWAVWTRGYYGGLKKVEGNTLYILRFVIEDEGVDEEYLVQGVKSVLQIAQAEAAEWQVQDVQLWNPPPLLEGAIEKSGLEHEYEEREKESIASLQWHGESSADVDWLLNEKYGWC
ncbi:hypothetical protein GQ53DRAFT_633407 [Thozetella sp. PMI_491]|nr:hypothetical protein GQ53DRAFT_633407 [Thozetella sp. PMI_491]